MPLKRRVGYTYPNLQLKTHTGAEKPKKPKIMTNKADQITLEDALAVLNKVMEDIFNEEKAAEKARRRAEREARQEADFQECLKLVRRMKPAPRR